MAIKKVKDMFRDLGDAKRILRELKLLRHFRPHENVVTILDIMVYPENSLDFRCTPLLNKAEYHVLVGREEGQVDVDSSYFFVKCSLSCTKCYIKIETVLPKGSRIRDQLLDRLKYVGDRLTLHVSCGG